MSCKELIYKNALTTIEDIYNESKYNKDVDLYRSYDIINAVNGPQIDSKQWLVNTLVPFLIPKYLYFDLKDVLVLGAWYGVTGLLLREHIDPSVKIWNIDSDPECEKYSNILKQDIPYAENNISITADAAEYFFENSDAYQVIINTSCEHMDPEDLQLLINMKNTETVVCFQSNNYHAEPEHINTHNSVEEFAEFLDLAHVIWKGTLKPSNDYERYMVIGL
jgi:hypothetical protein